MTVRPYPGPIGRPRKPNATPDELAAASQDTTYDAAAARISAMRGWGDSRVSIKAQLQRRVSREWVRRQFTATGAKLRPQVRHKSQSGTKPRIDPLVLEGRRRAQNLMTRAIPDAEWHIPTEQPGDVAGVQEQKTPPTVGVQEVAKGSGGA